ncbi:MAG: DNA polymerase III subunit alpha, partial [Bacteroidales bacterium]|nr:DNA polymerase III subunit alpha [Bacteroidales bacterium]
GDWEDFAKYAFNKSHATCYSWVSYQTAYLKAHYPAEFMASVLSHNLNDIKEITFFIDECSRMGIKVKGPSVNESRKNFVVNKEGNILFGLNAIKGVGEAVADAILEERDKNGSFKDIMDFVLRINPRFINKKSMESLANSGAFDCFEGMHRAQFFYPDRDNEPNFIEKLLRYATKVAEQKNSAQSSLFGDIEEDNLPSITFPQCEPWDEITRLSKEKEMTGFYISGHPLNQYRDEIKFFTNQTISNFKNDMEKFKNAPAFTFAAMISEASSNFGKNGKEFGRATLEDIDDSVQVMLFSDNYLRCKPFLTKGRMVLVTAKIEARMRESEELELKIISMTLLETVLTKMAKNITLTVDIDDITEKFSDELINICKKHKGEGTLKIVMNDPEIKKRVHLQCSKKINIAEVAEIFRTDSKWNYRIE